MVKNLPARKETWVCSLGRKDPLEKGVTTLSNILAWTIFFFFATAVDMWSALGILVSGQGTPCIGSTDLTAGQLNHGQRSLVRYSP